MNFKWFTYRQEFSPSLDYRKMNAFKTIHYTNAVKVDKNNFMYPIIFMEKHKMGSKTVSTLSRKSLLLY